MTDHGLEFYNAPVRELLKKYKVKLYSTVSPLKAQMAERYVRTIKTKIERLFTHTGKNNWVDSLEDLVKNINSSYNSAIKMTPDEVTKKNESEVFQNLYHKFIIMGKRKPKYQVGDLVKIANNKITFQVRYFYR
jgi:copper homeostasis protein CutC